MTTAGAVGEYVLPGGSEATYGLADITVGSDGRLWFTERRGGSQAPGIGALRPSAVGAGARGNSGGGTTRRPTPKSRSRCRTVTRTVRGHKRKATICRKPKSRRKHR